MKNIVQTCLLLVALITCSNVFCQTTITSKLSLQTQMLLREKAKNEASTLYSVSQSRTSAIKQNGIDMIDGFITVRNESDIAELSRHGVKVQTIIGTILTARMPVDSIESLGKLDGVKYLSISQKLKPHNDKARTASRVDLVHAGQGLPQAYTGKGVIVGVIDCGIDFNHINFKDANGKSRVKRARINESLYTTPEAIEKQTDDNESDSYGHGTHTTGIAAGSYTANGLQGMAPESDLVLCGGSLDDYNITNSLSYIFSYADSVGKPAVVNMSLGSNLGSHDGKDQFTQTVDNLIGDGKFLIISSGNSGEEYIHLHKECTQTDDSIPQLKTILKAVSDSIDYSDYDIWNSNESTISVKVVAINQYDSVVYSTPIFTCEPGNIIDYTSDDSNNKEFSKYFEQGYINLNSNVESYNGRFHTRLGLALIPASDTIRIGLWLYAPKDGIIDVWGADGVCYDFTSDGLDGYADGVGTFSNEICGEKTISVGAYNTRLQYTTLDGVAHDKTNKRRNLGDISSFSSYGTDFNRGTHPTVTAPGSMIFSSLDRYENEYNVPENQVDEQTIDGKTYQWGIMEGTSMSCPMVTGSIALWLQANPKLNSDDVKEIMERTSVRDEFVENSPERWGYGKLDTYAGLNYILTTTGVDDAIALKNPTRVVESGDNTFIVYMQTRQETIKLQVYSTTGICQHTGKVTMNHGKGSFNLNGAVTAGLYMLRLETADGETYTTKVYVK